jgi:PEP-CTERM motif
MLNTAHRRKARHRIAQPLRLTAIGSFLLVSAGAANAAAIVDQSQLKDDGTPIPITGQIIVQSFQQTNANISGAAVKLSRISDSPVPITISLSATLGGPVLASGTRTGLSGDFVEVDWSPVAVTPGAEYFLTFSSTNELSPNIAAFRGDPYAAGELFNGGSPQPFDSTFETFADVADAPEPAAILLLGMGLVGLVRRRRAKS